MTFTAPGSVFKRHTARRKGKPGGIMALALARTQATGCKTLISWMKAIPDRPSRSARVHQAWVDSVSPLPPVARHFPHHARAIRATETRTETQEQA